MFQLEAKYAEMLAQSGSKYRIMHRRLSKDGIDQASVCVVQILDTERGNQVYHEEVGKDGEDEQTVTVRAIVASQHHERPMTPTEAYAEVARLRAENEALKATPAPDTTGPTDEQIQQELTKRGIGIRGPKGSTWRQRALDAIAKDQELQEGLQQDEVQTLGVAREA